MEDDVGERSSFVVGLIENRAKEVPYLLSLTMYVFRENLSDISIPLLRIPIN